MKSYTKNQEVTVVENFNTKLNQLIVPKLNKEQSTKLDGLITKKGSLQFLLKNGEKIKVLVQMVLTDFLNFFWNVKGDFDARGINKSYLRRKQVRYNYLYS